MVIKNNECNNDCSVFVDSKQRQIREHLDFRSLAILKADRNEFRRLQAEIGKSGFITRVGALQFLDQKVIETMKIQKEKSDREETSLDQKVTRTLIRRKSTSSMESTSRAIEDESSARAQYMQKSSSVGRLEDNKNLRKEMKGKSFKLCREWMLQDINKKMDKHKQ
mmetsp:Transcript_13878/g.21148  ORF Transcript_13878/g.21148 Transcript_13878/m.21148 type:complete len:166 (-) Transcript_13878:40-537(-)